ncbi:acyl-[acyl-carrier-protein] thioesterase [Anaerococcus marasmi]|uniref:acyl-[acyl-carrier-protein] thioesterase n=1 Tax=Anaerococcus marasmi TaxID=2057797 RepID=UPI000CF92CFD|nr:acyl-ACP thioesterase domain-containing protein [Anaerococcus marasmi]
MKYKKKYTIGHMFCDRYGYLTMRNLASLMFDVSFDQASSLEKDIDMENFRWIAYSWEIDIKECVRLDDEIEITTIPTHMNRFYAYRDFIVEKNGEILVKAKAVFLLMDIERLRPVKILDDLVKAYGREEEVFTARDVKLEKDLEFIKDIYIRKADIDTNFHVNNAVYFDYIEELSDIFAKDIGYIKLVYRNEIRDKKSVRALGKKSGDEFSFALEDGSSKTYAYGKIRLDV